MTDQCTPYQTPYQILHTLVPPNTGQLNDSEGMSSSLQGCLLLKVGNWSLAVALHDLDKVVALPALATVPRVYPWVKGAAPIDGQWMPVIALDAYFKQALVPISEASKALIIKKNAKQVAITVNQIMGSAYFSADQFNASIEKNTAEVLHPYITGTYHTAEQDWLMMSVLSLVECSRFDTMVKP